MDLSNVGGFDKVEDSLECAMLSPMNRWNGNKDVMKEIVAWS